MSLFRALPMMIAAALAIAPSSAFAVDPDSAGVRARSAVHAVRIDQPVRIDGRLDEAVWSSALPVTEFYQIEPDEGAAASERTEARIVFDESALYVGVRLWDDGPISSRLGRRDMAIGGDSDWLGVMLDSDRDRHTAFGFDVNPSGVKRDLIKTINRDDNSWDPVWDAATTVDEEGWTVEMRIPFSQLRFSDENEQTWGIQIERLISRRGEYSASTFIPRNSQGGVPQYGDLTGLEGIRAEKRLELMPYALTRMDAAPGSATDFGQAIGLDLEYRVTSELSLSATVNPDFGQVELDPAVVNLSAYETFFPERRPFFVKDAGIFAFGNEAVGPGSAARNLFYSRRIGRSPQLATASSGAPEATRVLSAAKFTGKTASGWSIGLMGATTDAEWNAAPHGGEATLGEPFTNYFAGRVGRDLRDGRSAVGGIFTAVHRNLETDAAGDRLAGAAFTGGVDFRHDWSDRTWGLSGYLVGSHIRGGAGAMSRLQNASSRYFARPDAEHLELDPEAASLSGYAGQVQLRKQGGRHWLGDVALFATSPGYEPNDLGYNTRADLRGANAQLLYRETRSGKLFRNYTLVGQGIYVQNFAGDHVDNGVLFGAMARLQNFWSLTFNAGHSFPRLHDRFTRGGPVTAHPGSTTLAMVIGSDARRPVSGQLFVQSGRGEAEQSDLARLTVTARPAPSWNLSMGPLFQRTRRGAQYLTTVADPSAEATFGNRYVFAPLNQTTAALETRLNMTFTRDLTLELFAQPFISSVAFGEAKELVAPRTYEFADYSGEQGVPDRSFNVRSLRGNAVLRWEWRTGSTLYLAWQQQRENFAPGVSDFDFRRDQTALFRTEPENVLMLKVSHWLNF